MKCTFFVLGLFLVAFVGYQSVRIIRLIQISSNLVGDAHGFERTEGILSILVLGDSTAVGVGSPAEGSVAGRLSRYMNAAVENHAKSGARVDDVKGQFKQIRQTHYDLVLIQVGANDVIRFSSIPKAAASLEAILFRGEELSDHIVFLTGGKIGSAPFFPKPFGFLWTHRAAALRKEFRAVAEKNNAAYVDLYSIPDPFKNDPIRYYASDGLHLTADGYEFWYEQVRKIIEQKWPKLVEHE